MRIISTLIVAAMPVLCYSQSDFKSGFIVKNNGDTVKGFLKEDVQSELQKGVVFKSSNTDAGTTLTFSDIKAFGYDGGNTFKKISYADPSDNSSNELFAKLMLNGHYTLYSFYKSDRQYYVVKTSEDSTYLLRDASY